MATCSFITATNARNIARDDTLIWTEICEVQQAILAAIDGDPCATPPVQGAYSVIVAGGTPFTTLQEITAALIADGGTGFSIISATALIDANGTGGINATLTPVIVNGVVDDFTITNAGSGYSPVSATAVLSTPNSLTNGQDETSYNGTGIEGTFIGGNDYFVGEVTTLSNGTTVLVDTVDAGQQRFVIQSGQDETNYDNTPVSEGTFDGGLGFTPSPGIDDGATITLNDGTVITIDNVAGGGAVDQFTVTSGSTSSSASTGLTRGQLTTQSSTGIGFTLTPDTANETIVGPVTEFTVTASGSDFFLAQSLVQTTTTGIGTSFSLTPSTGNATALPHAGSEAVLTPLVDDNGIITGVVIIDGGTGYIDQNPIVFPQPGVNAAAVATVSGGIIIAVTVTNGGTGYSTVNPLVTVTHPTGIGFAGIVLVSAGSTAVFRVDIVAGVVTNVTVTEGGTGYTNDTGLTFLLTATAGGGDGAAEITYDVVNGIVTNPSVSVGGTTYSNGSNIRVAAADTPEPPGTITGISIQNGGSFYGDVFPTIVVSDATGSGASILVTGVDSGPGTINSIQLADGGFGYTQTPSVLFFDSDGSADTSGAALTLTVEDNTFGTVPTDYFDVLSGQATDPVIADQIQFVLDYFTALDYNIRAQVNPATANTMQWQIIW